MSEKEPGAVARGLAFVFGTENNLNLKPSVTVTTKVVSRSALVSSKEGGEKEEENEDMEVSEAAERLMQVYELTQAEGLQSARAIVSSGFAFWSTLALSQLLGGALGLSCAFSPVASLAGAGVVLAAAQAVQVVALSFEGSPALTSEESAFMKAGTVGLFLTLGGRFSSIFPSDILRPGAFARDSIQATANYATSLERTKVKEIGHKYGCHSCGKRAILYHADHMPPIKIATLTTSGFWGWFRKYPDHQFYPQCQPCSSLQARTAKLCSKHVTLQQLRYHLFTFRAYHTVGLLTGAALIFSKDRTTV